TAVPEKWGGLGLPKRVTALVTERMAAYGSFSVTYGAHSGIGTLPIVYFGNEEQKGRFLPKLASGELIGAYALSEPGSGSDALGARTVAKLNDEGTHYVLNGTKQWITNGAFADVFIVFCQIVDADGTANFSALIVEKDTGGFSIGPEEHKLGIRGSSTTPLIFEDALIPIENVLGEIGRGHEIAFNILNVGRYTLAVGVTGGAKQALHRAISYASERKQFKTPVIEFGALRQKVANAAADIYAMEALSFRVAGLTDAMTTEMGELAENASGRDKMRPIEEYAIESSIGKVWCSEKLNEIASECLQMYGGYGYVEDYPAEMAFRDARINMIFEGTNEVNRLLIPGMLLKRAMKGRLPVMAWLGALGNEAGQVGEGPLEAERDATERFKGVAGVLLQAAAMKYMRELEGQQQILLLLADLISDCYVADSAVGRSVKRHRRGMKTDLTDAMARVTLARAQDRVRANAGHLLSAMFEGDAYDAMETRLKGFWPNFRSNLVADRKQIADAVVATGGYQI
ncbi:MAG: alkylation response protein AidB-like acyl-CoA dehydrogenase, partial [Myxococcota bacterium]